MWLHNRVSTLLEMEHSIQHGNKLENNYPTHVIKLTCVSLNIYKKEKPVLSKENHGLKTFNLVL